MKSKVITEILKSYSKIYPISINNDGGGFGAIILITINQLRYCERNNLYPVIAYDKSCKNSFFDASVSNELWSQYFEPVMPFSYQDLVQSLQEIDERYIHRLSSIEAIRISEEDPDSVYSFPFGKWRTEDLGDIDKWYSQERRKGRDTINKYVRPKPHILEKVTSFYEKHFSNLNVLGVHIRGTDLHYAPVVSPAEYFPHIDHRLEKDPSLKVFLATDQAQYIPVFEKRYGNRLVYSDCFRSDNEVAPFQRTELSPYQKGEEVLLDILLLSRANFLIKGSSNVGEMALYFNPELECLDLAYKKQKAFGQSYDQDWDNHTNPPAWKLVSKRGVDTLAKDAASQNTLQKGEYKFRKLLKLARIKGGALKKNLKVFLTPPR